MSQDDIRIDFYVLADAAESARLTFACRLTEKAYGLDHRVYVHADSAAEVRELDDLMWTFRQGSFVPHAVAGSSRPASPVTIGCADSGEPTGDVLINLSATIPTFFDRFGRIAEIIDGDQQRRRSGRERFSYYRDNGYSPSTHRLDGAAR